MKLNVSFSQDSKTICRDKARFPGLASNFAYLVNEVLPCVLEGNVVAPFVIPVTILLVAASQPDLDQEIKKYTSHIHLHKLFDQLNIVIIVVDSAVKFSLESKKDDRPVVELDLQIVDSVLLACFAARPKSETTRNFPRLERQRELPLPAQCNHSQEYDGQGERRWSHPVSETDL